MPLQDTFNAIEILMKEYHHFPDAMGMSLDMYESLLKSVKDSPVLELEQISQICTDGLFLSPMVPTGTAVVVSTGAQNFDIAVAENVSIAYLGPSDDMNYKFRVYESPVLPVKRPKAICVIR